MSLIYGTTTIKKVIYNNTEIKTLYYGSTKVFTTIDPTKTSYTQDEFIQICNNNLQNQMKLGAKISLNNTYCNTYEVIGVDHDGTKCTVDLMATTQVGDMAFSGSINNNYQNSDIRTWINGTYYNAFDSSIRNIAKTMVVKSATSLTAGINLNDKVKLLSTVEMNYATFDSAFMPGYSTYKEGEPYTVFTRGNWDANIANRWRPAGSYGNSSRYWLRSRRTDSTNFVWLVSSQGYGSDFYYSYGNKGVLPVLRF